MLKCKGSECRTRRVVERCHGRKRQPNKYIRVSLSQDHRLDLQRLKRKILKYKYLELSGRRHGKQDSMIDSEMQQRRTIGSSPTATRITRAKKKKKVRESCLINFQDRRLQYAESLFIA